jgi:hypothetical protein
VLEGKEGSEAIVGKGSEEEGKERRKLKGGDAAKVDVMMRMIRELCPRERWTTEDVKKVVEEAYLAADGNYGEREAQEWGADFVWPSDIRLRDEQMAQECDFSVERMARVQHEAMK